MTTKVNVEKFVVDGKTYVAEDRPSPPSGKRAVIVVDRGWIGSSGGRASGSTG